MADIRLGQSSTGKWKLTLTNNDTRVPANVEIPVTLRYQGANPVTLTVRRGSTSEATTEWYTQLGTSINTNEITVSGEKTVGDTTYRVTAVNWISVTPAGGGGDDPTLSLSYSGGNISYNGGTATVSIDSNTGWTISSNQSWATLSTTSGNGNGSTVVSFTSNGGQSTRTVTLTAKTTDNRITKTLQITQNANPTPPTPTPTLTISASKTSGVSADGETVTITITSNTGWTLASNQSWATLGTTSGSNNGTSSLSIGANTATGASSRSVTITATYGNNQQKSVTITQNAPSEAPYLTITLSSNSIESNGGTIGITVSSNTGWTLYLSSQAESYASVNPVSGNGNGGSTLTISRNDSTESRNIRVYAKYTDGSSEVTHKDVEQAGVTPSLSIEANKVTVSSASEEVELTITSNIDWEMSISESWASVPLPHAGSGDGVKVLSINAYEGDQPRQVTVTVSGSGLSDSVTITQNGNYYLNFWDTDRNTLTDIPWDANGRYPLHVDSNIEWTIAASDTSWITIVDNAGNPKTGGEGNDYNIYVKFSHNASQTDTREGTITISPVDSSLNVPDDVLDVFQNKQEAPFAVFVDRTQTVDGNRTSSYEITDFSVCANTYWQIVSLNTDWISIGNGCVGNSTAQLPDGKQWNTLNISPNPTVSERNGTIIIRGQNSEQFDSASIRQTRGFSTIDLDCSTTTIPSAAGGVNIYVTSNQRWYISEMGDMTIEGYPSTQVFESGTTIHLYLNVPENTGNTDLTRVITVKTEDPADFVVTDSHTFVQTKPVEPGWIKIDKVGSGSGHASITYGPDGFDDADGQSPSEHDLTFYIKTNTQCCVRSHTEGVTLFDNNGNEITQGGTGGQYFGPTPGDDWAAFRIHLPANTALGRRAGMREFNVELVTNDKSYLDFNNDVVELHVNQYGDEFYIDDIHWDTNFPTEYTLSSNSHIWVYDQSQSTAFVPNVCLLARYYNAAGTYNSIVNIGDNVQYGYTLANCGLDNGRISVTYPDWFYGIETPQAEGGSYCPSAQTPYAFNVKANQAYCPQTGNTREGDVVITYSYGGTNVPLTIHVTQEYDCVQPPELGMDLYVSTTYGGRGASVKEDTVNTHTSSGNRQISFSLTSGSLSSGDANYYISMTDEGPASSCFSSGVFGTEGWVYSDIDNHFMNPTANVWPGHSVDCTLVLKNDITSDFFIKITGYKTDDDRVTTELTLHIHVI